MPIYLSLILLSQNRAWPRACHLQGKEVQYSGLAKPSVHCTKCYNKKQSGFLCKATFGCKIVGGKKKVYKRRCVKWDLKEGGPAWSVYPAGGIRMVYSTRKLKSQVSLCFPLGNSCSASIAYLVVRSYRGYWLLFQWVFMRPFFSPCHKRSVLSSSISKGMDPIMKTYQHTAIGFHL